MASPTYQDPRQKQLQQKAPQAPVAGAGPTAPQPGAIDPNLAMLMQAMSQNQTRDNLGFMQGAGLFGVPESPRNRGGALNQGLDWLRSPDEMQANIAARQSSIGPDVNAQAGVRDFITEMQAFDPRSDFRRASMGQAPLELGSPENPFVTPDGRRIVRLPNGTLGSGGGGGDLPFEQKQQILGPRNGIYPDPRQAGGAGQQAFAMDQRDARQGQIQQQLQQLLGQGVGSAIPQGPNYQSPQYQRAVGQSGKDSAAQAEPPGLPGGYAPGEQEYIQNGEKGQDGPFGPRVPGGATVPEKKGFFDTLDDKVFGWLKGLGGGGSVGKPAMPATPASAPTSTPAAAQGGNPFEGPPNLLAGASSPSGRPGIIPGPARGGTGVMNDLENAGRIAGQQGINAVGGLAKGADWLMQKVGNPIMDYFTNSRAAPGLFEQAANQGMNQLFPTDQGQPQNLPSKVPSFAEGPGGKQGSSNPLKPRESFGSIEPGLFDRSLQGAEGGFDGLQQPAVTEFPNWTNSAPVANPSLEDQLQAAIAGQALFPTPEKIMQLVQMIQRRNAMQMHGAGQL